MTSNAYWVSLSRWISIVVLITLFISGAAYAQGYEHSRPNFMLNAENVFQLSDTTNQSQEYPDPKKVLRRSLIIPGWGQITNKQAWKVPIVYGLLGGLIYYSIDLHKSYHDYRAAFYNLNPDTPDDNRFGSTPDYISENSNLNFLRQNRNFFRNRRDLVYVFIGLAYALNAVDAYVFAHLRSFDVSDDLSMNIRMKSGVLSTRQSGAIPSVSLSIKF